MRNATDAGTGCARALDAVADRTGRAAWLVPATNRVPLHSPRERDGYGISSEVDATDPPRSLYLADGHPAAYVFDDESNSGNGMPGLFAPYFSREPVISTDTGDYANPDARLVNATIYNWMHPLSQVVTSLIAAGMTLDWLHEHDAVPWRMFRILIEGSDGLYRWPDKPWLPLAFSLSATRHQQGFRTRTVP